MKDNDDEFLISKIDDKLKFCETRNKIQNTDFLDLAQQKQVENYLKSRKFSNYMFCGGFEEAERKILLIYPEKLKELIDKIDLNEFICVIRITLPNMMQGKYTHKNYLGGLMKLGLERNKIGDIIVDNDGADILILPEIVKFLLSNLTQLTRFSKSKFEQIQIENLRKIDIKTEIVKITVASMRIDNIVAELARCSRGKASEILEEERVFINYEIVTKASKEIKENDIITIRGKGRFIIKEVVGNSRKGRLFVNVERYT